MKWIAPEVLQAVLVLAAHGLLVGDVQTASNVDQFPCSRGEALVLGICFLDVSPAEATKKWILHQAMYLI